MPPRISQRTRWVYGGLITLWLLAIAWQGLEHRRFRQAAHAQLANRGRDISSTLGLVIHSQRRFGGFISKDRIESALNSLINPGELNSIALLNNAGEIVASAGPAIDFDLRRLAPRAEYWAGDTVALMNLVDLGTNVGPNPDPRSATIVFSPSELPPPFGTNRPAGPPPARPPETVTAAGDTNDVPPPPPDDRRRPPPPWPGLRGETSEVATNTLADASDTNNPARPRGRPRRGDGRFPFGRPFWMSEEEYRSLQQKQGVHSFVLLLSTQSMHLACRQDLWLRLVVGAFASMSAFGLAVAWRNLARSSELEVRLARAAELNARLKEMNFAAAGLAHETRNPLNIIRGLAQLISKQPSTAPEVQTKVQDIISETDRVTAQLNEFINYSRPREVRWSTVPLQAVASEVARALSSDVDDRAIQLRVAPDLPAIEGDEQLVRQALFNLLINAIQAVDRGGEIDIVGERVGPDGLRLEIRDNGHGVSPEDRSEIFKPYFTTHEEGTGLGLAIVQQIVLAHGWEIECRPNQPKGAVFLIHHLKIAAHQP